jgi:hypothetical protein
MSNLPTPENPAWPDVYELSVDDPVAGGPDGVDNRPHKELLERTEYLKAQVDKVSTAIENQEIRLAAVEGTSAVTVSRAQELAWAESDEGFSFEMFGDTTHTWRNVDDVAVTCTVAGDDSVDVESTSGLKVGSSYVIFGDEEAETVVVAEIFSPTRFRAESALTKDRESGTLSLTNWDVRSGYAIAPDDGVFYSKPLDVLRYWDDGVFVIRRDAGDAIVSVAARNVGEAQWHDAELVESKQAASGTRDERYRVPVGGVVELRISVAHGVSSKDVRVEHMVLLTSPKAGRADSVRRPVNITPANESTGIMETPTLTGDAYRSLYGLAQDGAEFRVASDKAFSNIIYMGTEAGTVVSHQVAAGQLVTDSVYWFQCRYKDSEGAFSPWSEPTAFATGSVFEYVEQPINVAPAEGATNVPPCPTLQSGAFKAVGGEDTHSASQWQVATDNRFTNIVYDSTECADLLSHTVANALILDQKHYFRCRHKGTSFGWSAWSIPSMFTPHEVTLPLGDYCGGTVDADGKGVVFATPGTYTFVVPDGVTEVCAVAVGGGGAGMGYSGGSGWGGGGGGLRWINNIPVVPGESIPVVVGAGGVAVLESAPGGGSSSFGMHITAHGGGGGHWDDPKKGQGGGGVGGSGGKGGTSFDASGGGGGAGGYSGQGGDTGKAGAIYYAGGGGGGGGASQCSGGGGVGLYGEGNSGSAGYSSDGMFYGGGGGSNGTKGGDTVNNTYLRGGAGGKYGGGGGAGSRKVGGSGGDGAVRIMFGASRSFPNNATLVPAE